VNKAAEKRGHGRNIRWTGTGFNNDNFRAPEFRISEGENPRFPEDLPDSEY